MAGTPISLLERLRLRPDGSAWKQLVELYTPLLQSWLRRQYLQQVDADDVIQEVFRVLVAKLPEFQHSGQPGAFRSWLRQVMVHCLANFRRTRQAQRGMIEPKEAVRALEQLQDPHSELSRLWDQEHNQHVAGCFLRLVESKFEPTTYQAFRGVVLEGRKTAEVAAALSMTVNAVRLAKSHVLRWLREASRGLLD